MNEYKNNDNNNNKKRTTIIQPLKPMIFCNPK